jgi:hypothetical protein
LARVRSAAEGSGICARLKIFFALPLRLMKMPLLRMWQIFRLGYLDNYTATAVII